MPDYRTQHILIPSLLINLLCGLRQEVGTLLLNAKRLQVILQYPILRRHNQCCSTLYHNKPGSEQDPVLGISVKAANNWIALPQGRFK